MKITDVEAIVLRQPALNDDIADGSQDDLVILVHTDEGITGIGEVDSAPEAVRALVQAPGSHAIANSLHDLLVGEDPTRRRAALAEDVPRPDLHRPPRDRAARDQRHRHRALGHQGQGDGQARLRADRRRRSATRSARTRRC